MVAGGSGVRGWSASDICGSCRTTSPKHIPRQSGKARGRAAVEALSTAQALVDTANPNWFCDSEGTRQRGGLRSSPRGGHCRAAGAPEIPRQGQRGWTAFAGLPRPLNHALCCSVSQAHHRLPAGIELLSDTGH